MALTLRVKCACGEEVLETYTGVPAPGATDIMGLRQRLCNHAEAKRCVGGNVGAYAQQVLVEACWEGQRLWSPYTPPPLLALPQLPLTVSINTATWLLGRVADSGAAPSAAPGAAEEAED